MPEANKPNKSTGPTGQTNPTGATGNTEGVRRLMTEFQSAWNNHDVKAMASCWAPEGDLINPMGRVANGRNEVERLISEEQSTRFRTSTFSLQTTSQREIADNIVLTNAIFEVKDATLPDGKTGDLKGLVTFLCERKGDKWLITAARPMVPMTAMTPPGPGKP